MEDGFQPTPPARTETRPKVRVGHDMGISTHSAREDGDISRDRLPNRFYNFNPLRPRGRRPHIVYHIHLLKYFNPLRPRGRRLGELVRSFSETLFQPTPPARTETCATVSHSIRLTRFQPTPPARTETAILHKKTNNSSSHFHNQITSYPLKSPPTYPAHIQNRSHCAVFPVRIPP